jgi:hypothetical protein
MVLWVSLKLAKNMTKNLMFDVMIAPVCSLCTEVAGGREDSTSGIILFLYFSVKKQF